MFLSKEDACEEFACLFVDQPDLLEATSPAALPASFGITLEPGADPTAVRTSLETLPSVDTVAETEPIAMPLPSPEDFRTGP